MANNLIDQTASLPELPRQKQIFARADSIMIRRYGPGRDGMGRAESSLADLDAIMPESQSLLDDLHALARPASKQEIAKNLIILVKCYPAATADGETYGRLLIEDVASIQPSIGDLEGGCRELRQTSRFCPAISEVLKAISDAKQRRHDITRQIANIVKSRDHQVREVEKERRQHQEYLDYHRARYQHLDMDDRTSLPL